MTIDTKVEYVLMGSLSDGKPFILRKDATIERIMPKEKTRKTWNTVTVQRVTTTMKVEVIRAWNKGSQIK